MSTEKTYPDNWQIKSYDPNEHMMDLKGRDYLNVQNRLLWFIRDQRELIVRGLAQMPYIIRTELVEHDREKGYALFMTYIRDVLGNETTAYGSETAKDFNDYAEKAGTKSEGRALLNMGYGTAAAPEMDEGERVVDTPVERKAKPAPPAAKPLPTPAPAAATSQDDEPATAEQQERMRRARETLGITDKSIVATDNRLRYGEAEARIANYIAQHKQRQMRPPAQNGARP